MSLPLSLFELLVSYKKEICDFEYSQFIIDNEKWGSKIVLTKENVENKIQGKTLKFISNERFKVESFSQEDVVT